jgi:hypothetical protein
MSFKKPDIQDMEYFKYAESKGGEIESYMYNVCSYSNNGDVLIMYSGFYNVTNKNIPKRVEDFPTKYIIDLKKFTLISMEYDNSNNYFSPKEHASEVYYIKMDFDYNNLIAQSVIRLWDGNNIKTETSRINLKKGYSYFYFLDNTCMFSMIDWSKPAGVYYLVMPQFLKDPEPVSGRVEQRGIIIKTPAGKFITDKISGEFANPFLGNLMKGFTENSYTWVDQKGVVIEFTGPWQYKFILTETGTWRYK